VLDIACNDGSQLNAFQNLGLRTYGIDPAENLYNLSSQNHQVICDYFTARHTGELKNRNLDVITAQNVFAHNSYPLEFLQTCREIMHDGSRLFVQTSQADMVQNNEFDTIYHEHLSFFNANSMQALVERAGLHLLDIVKTPIHGNSYVFVIGKTPGDGDRVNQVLEQERELGLQNLITYDVYAERCRQVIKDLTNTLDEFRARGYKLVGYGAAAKGMTLLNFGQIRLDFIIDDNTLKQGLYTPGTGDAVVGIDALTGLEQHKLAFVPLAWNFFAEIRAKIKSRRDQSDDVFVRYFPKISVEQ
jgi:SAM-dependent methyltransferase